MDQATKTLVEHMMPTEMIIKEPSEAAMKHVIAHARKTGDLRSLSRPDLKVIALVSQKRAEECRVDDGDWPGRETPRWRQPALCLLLPMCRAVAELAHFGSADVSAALRGHRCVLGGPAAHTASAAAPAAAC